MEQSVFVFVELMKMCCIPLQWQQTPFKLHIAFGFAEAMFAIKMKKPAVGVCSCVMHSKGL